MTKGWFVGKGITARQPRWHRSLVIGHWCLVIGPSQGRQAVLAHDRLILPAQLQQSGQQQFAIFRVDALQPAVVSAQQRLGRTVEEGGGRRADEVDFGLRAEPTATGGKRSQQARAVRTTGICETTRR